MPSDRPHRHSSSLVLASSFWLYRNFSEGKKILFACILRATQISVIEVPFDRWYPTFRTCQVVKIQSSWFNRTPLGLRTPVNALFSFGTPPVTLKGKFSLLTYGESTSTPPLYDNLFCQSVVQHQRISNLHKLPSESSKIKDWWKVENLVAITELLYWHSLTEITGICYVGSITGVVTGLFLNTWCPLGYEWRARLERRCLHPICQQLFWGASSRFEKICQCEMEEIINEGG